MAWPSKVRYGAHGALLTDEGGIVNLNCMHTMAASATRQVRRLLRLAALPVTAGSAGWALGIPVVKAEAAPVPEGAKKRTVLARDLPIYDDRADSVEYRFVPVDTSGYLYQAVSVVRQNVWKFSDSLQGAVDKTKQAYKFAEKTEKDIIDYIKTEEGFYPRVGAIALAGLTGVVLARKGGVFRKVVFSGALMGATASICYPYQVVELTKTEYEAFRAFWRDSMGSGMMDRVQGRMRRSPDERRDKGTKEEAPIQEGTPPTSGDAVATAPSADTTQPPGDDGMSHPEDKDLYSTRT